MDVPLKTHLWCASALLCCVGLLTAAAFANRVGDIEFFGYTDFAKPSQLLKELPIHIGDPITAQTKQRIRQAVLRVTGRPPTDVALICCDAHGDWTAFIGLPGPTVEKFSYYPPPKEDARLPTDVNELYSRLDTAIRAAVHKGGTAPQEDDSQGYSLINYPPARVLQLKLRQYALGHEDLLLRVLKDSSDARQRQIAADALGYGRQSPAQIAALVRATCDPDGEVRNNATRALGVLASSSPQLARQIPPDSFIAMIKSGVWTDRNKAAFVFMELTRARSPALLAKLRAQALEPLIEMAK